MIGYDTLYAIQDIEDDALVGVKSSARRMGGQCRGSGSAIFYALALLGWGAAIWQVRPDPLALAALIPAAIHLAHQAWRADPADGAGRAGPVPLQPLVRRPGVRRDAGGGVERQRLTA